MQRSSVILHPSTHIRTAEVTTSEARRLCLPEIAHVPPAQNSSVSPTIDRWSYYSGASKPEWEIEDSGLKPAVPPGSSATARPAGRVGVARGRRHVMRLREPSEGRMLGKRNEEGNGRAAGRARSFIQLESGGWPVHAPCPMGRAPNPGGGGKHRDRDYRINYSKY